MFLTKQLRAGVLLYALFMAAIFSLLLQFYVGQVKAGAQLQAVRHQQAQAMLMAELTKQLADGKKGVYGFDVGSASYVHENHQLTVTVQLNQGASYTYHFLKDMPEKTREAVKDLEAEVVDGEKTDDS